MKKNEQTNKIYKKCEKKSRIFYRFPPIETAKSFESLKQKNENFFSSFFFDKEIVVWR